MSVKETSSFEIYLKIIYEVGLVIKWNIQVPTCKYAWTKESLHSNKKGKYISFGYLHNYRTCGYLGIRDLNLSAR